MSTPETSQAAASAPQACPDRVRTRCVFFLGGYEPIPPQRQHERYIRELARTEKAWSIKTEVGPLEMSDDQRVGLWRTVAGGPNWSTRSEYRSLLWHDMVLADFARPGWQRVLRGIRVFGEFLLNGTAFRYLAVNWRYGLFFLYPVFLLLAFAAVATYAAVLIVGFAGLTGDVWPYLSGAAVALAVFALLMMWPGKFLLLDYMMDDWIFAHEFVHRSREGLDERLDRFAAELAKVLREGGYDEVVFAAHSLGCALKIAVVDRALRLVPEFGRNGERLALLSTGSSILKIAFHPQGRWMKEAIARVSASDAVFWIEYQSMADPISFYKVDPIKALRLSPTGRPLIRRVHIRDMLSPESYRRFKANFFRLHRQLVMGNEKRYFYDYYMVCCGPIPLKTRVLKPEIMVASFAADGALIETKTSTFSKD